ncbi:MAG: DUF3108 domain-containing protein [Candidatus Thiodiazotropha sp.]
MAGLGLLFWGSLLFADESLLQPFSASFRVHRNIIPLGSLSLSLELGEDGSYTYTAHTYPGFLAGMFSRNEVLEESHGQVRADWVVPSQYHYRDQDQDSENAELAFDWEHLTVDTQSGGITWTQEILPGTQDKLSQQLQVHRHLADGRQNLAYQVADGGKLKTYEFRVDGEEVIETPYGTFGCLRVRRSKEAAPPDYTIWFAPELDFFPLMIERQQGGHTYRMELESLSLTGTP